MVRAGVRARARVRVRVTVTVTVRVSVRVRVRGGVEDEELVARLRGGDGLPLTLDLPLTLT